MSKVTLKTYSFIDSLQPQLATFVGTTARGFLPIPGDAALYVEIAPGIAINTVTDVALKSTKVRPAMQIVERAFGLLEVHHHDQGEVRQAGQAILETLELKEEQRQKPKIVSNQVIRPVDRIISMTFVIGSALAAAGGILVGIKYPKIEPLMGMMIGLKAFVAAVLGGIGNIGGAVLGAMIMGVAEEFVVGYGASTYRDALAFGILIIILLFKPAGLLGRFTVEKV